MLARRHRLCRKADFARLRRHGRRFTHPLVVLIVDKQPATTADGLSVSRFAFSASRRVGDAVRRNRAKRLMREAVRLHLAQVKPQWDCLFIARRKVPQASFADVETAVLTLLQRAKLLEP